MDFQGLIIMLILIYLLWWKAQLVLFESSRLDDFSFSSSKSGDWKIVMAHAKHVGLDFIGHSMVYCKSLFI